MKILNFKLFRQSYKNHRTTGILTLEGKFYGYTLEDEVRPEHIKIKHKTAISCGNYSLSIKHSNKYHERRVYLDNVPLFQGIQIHGGNDESDTSGCILLAKNSLDNGKIQGSLKDQIIKDVDECDFAFIEIINLNQMDP